MAHKRHIQHVVLAVSAILLAVAGAFVVKAFSAADHSYVTTGLDSEVVRGGISEAGARPAPTKADQKIWKPPALTSLPEGTLRHVGGVRVKTPQTYEATIDVVGWDGSAPHIMCIHIRTAALLGKTDARTGREMARPEASETDHSSRLEGLTVLSGTTPRVRANWAPTQKVRLILIPVGDGASLYIDESQR